uniref:Uncharacterized protein n=1 Tax=viral metagenome TaxID=1070528 RepID=A0A6M3K3Z0_9ZZZZ
MARTLDEVLLIERGMLDDATTGGTLGAEFTDAELELITQQILEEVSEHSANIVREVCLTHEDSREIDISGIENFGILYAEYPIGKSPRERRNVIPIDNDTIEIDTTLSPADADSGVLTGTVTFTAGSTAVTGSGTTFTTELAADYHIRKSTGSRWYRIASVTSATALVLAEVCRGEDGGADTASVTAYYDEEVAYLFCKKNHKLADGGTLTGTVTFTSGSTAISGAGTAFTTELVVGSRIKKSSGTNIYRVASITSNTALVLTSTCKAADNGADTVSLTIFYDKDDTTLDSDEEKAVIVGSVATAALTYINNIRTHIKEATTLLNTVDAVIVDMADRLSKAISYMTTGSAQIADERTTAETAIDGVSAGINRALDDLALGETYINKVSYGGNPESDYGVYASKELQAATELLQQAGSYMALHSTSGRYSEYAGREISLANGLLNQASGILRQVTSRLSLAGATNSYQAWANNQYAIYQRALRKIEKTPVWKEYPKD